MVSDSHLTTHPDSYRCGQVAIIGRPNVGKSTLLNTLIGVKLSIVSAKPQTTRHPIQGVLTTEHAQYIFLDTPGFQTSHGGALNRLLNRTVTQVLTGVDVVILVIEAGKWSQADKALLAFIPPGIRSILVMNKLDKVTRRDSLYTFIQGVMQDHAFDAVVPLSANSASEKKSQSSCDTLLKEISLGLPEAPPLFEADQLTDRSERFLCAELLREKIFRLVGDELPYGCTVVIEAWQEEDQLRKINACILIDRDSHKPILLGAGGERIKHIASAARTDMEKLLDARVYLEVYVKVRKGWANQASSLRELGYE